MPNNLESRVVDLGAACLVCLTEEPGGSSIYGHDLEPPHMLILDKIRSCTGLQLECPVFAHLQGWPDKICQQCHIELTVAYRFREKCATVEKLFQSAAGLSPLQLEQQQQQQMQLKLELEQHQLRLPATLKIKRLEMEPVSAAAGSVGNATESPPYYPDMVEEEEEEEGQGAVDDEVEAEAVAPSANAVSLLPDEAMVLSLGDLDEPDPIKMRPEDATTDDDDDDDDEEEEEEEDKLLALTPWDNDQTPEHLYEIETPLMEEEMPPPPPPPPPPVSHPPMRTQPPIQLRKRTYRRVFPIIKLEAGVAAAERDDEFEPVVSAKRRPYERMPKICDVCGNTYKYQHALNAHMRRHNNERPYPCEVCQKAFISNVELRRHMRVHTGQKPYGCRFCERRFSDFGSSKKHERIHTGERPYVCEVCHKGFAYAHVLSVHRRTHTGKKQFQCTKCDKGFTKKSYLSAHMEQHRGAATGTGSGSGTGEGEGAAGLTGIGNLRLPVRKTEAFSLDSVGLGEQSKVLEECIVTNDFMFNEEDEDAGNGEDEAAEEAEDDDDGELDHHESYPPQPDFDDVDGYQSVRSVKELVGDLLDSEEFVDESKYLID